MTNEELAERIYAGDTGLYSALWDNLKRYIYRLCNAYYKRHRERCAALCFCLACPGSSHNIFCNLIKQFGNHMEVKFFYHFYIIIFIAILQACGR